MDSERWKKIEDIFQDALDLSGEARKNFINEKTGDDAGLRAEVEKLVARFEEEDEFLESPVWTDSVILGNTLKNRVASSLENEILPESSEKSFTGKRVGVYRLTDQIGKGGMGVVYAAERADGEFHQKVALKLIKRGMDTDFIISRFRHERQILAGLNHPNIARLLDGGTTDDDLPFFVMEFIEGEPLLKYCEEKNLDLRQKLKIFLQVCAPIIYAHRRKIIHRDIKPSNILVNEDGEPKLLDFGIAKLLDTDSIHESLLPTATAMRLMTPEYASPEQVRGEEITTASDQYSLGVLLYELITGARPYKFPSRSPHEIARVICEEIPSEPSSGSFGKILTGEIDIRFDEEFCKKLDRIVLKTLRKNPHERYASVEEFAADIERFLRSESVRAESFAKDSVQPETSSEKEKSRDTKDFERTTRGNDGGEKIKKIPREKAISPRMKGVKQGIFLIILSVISIPIFLLLTVTAIIPPPLVTAGFILFFFSGFVRILYAFLFESGKRESDFSSENEIEVAEAETRLINSLAPRETIVGSQSAFEKTTESEKVIAVLPFRHLNTLSGENTGGIDFLSVGLADSLITRISNVRQFVVRPTSSVLKFGAGEIDSLEAGKELNVGFVVEGNIVKTETRIRVSVQLLDVEKRSTIWAERFEENFTDVLEIEDLISAKVVESLLPKLSGDQQKRLEKRGTENAAAHEAYLRGRYYFNFYTDEGFQKAIRCYKKAVELDPKYAQAHAAIADYYNWMGMMNILPAHKFYPPAKSHALRAVELDDKLSDAHAALGLTKLYGEFDWQTSEREMVRAVELNPNNSIAYLWLTHALSTQGRIEESLNCNARAIELDPSSLQNYLTQAWAFYFARRFDEAVKKADEMTEKFPVSPFPYFAKSCFLSITGKGEEALQTSEKMLELSDDNLFIYGRAQAFAAAGKRRKALALIESADKNPTAKRYIANYHTAVIYCLLNEKEKALESLERAVAAHEGMLIWIGIEPLLDLLRDDSRFMSLLERINHPLAGKSDSAARGFDAKQTVFESNTGERIKNKKSKFPAALGYVLLAVVALVFGFAAYNFISHLKIDTSSVPPEERWKNNFASMMNVRRLNATGTVRRVVVSPDGKQVAYVSGDNQDQGLRIRETDSETERELVAPEAIFYLDMKFSPDGKYIYYLIDRTASPRILYRVPTGGGASEKISEEIFNSFALSSDGRKIAYDFANKEKKNYNIRIADLIDGKTLQNPQFVAEAFYPDYYMGSFTFSPDGGKLMYAVSKINESKEVVNLFVYDFETQTETQLTTRNFSDITGGVWRGGGEEIVVCATEENSSLYQLWLVSFPSGEVTHLTNDFYDYSGASLTADSSVLATVKKDSTSNLWTSELAASSRDFDSKTKQVTNKNSRQDGIEGVSWTKDGRILYISSANGESGIAVMKTDGSDNQVIPVKTSKPAHPVLTADNRYLVFADEKDQKMNIRRFDLQTGEATEISSRYAVTPTLSPDDRFVFYSTFSNTSNRTSIHRKPLLGGDEIEITPQISINSTVSPDGKRVACLLSSRETGGEFQLAIFPAEKTDGNPLKIIKAFQHGNLENPQSRPLAWSPDGKFLYSVDSSNNISNIFRTAIEGDQKPVQVTFFTSGKIFDFALAPDGKTVVLSRGSTATDIVLFKKSK